MRMRFWEKGEIGSWYDLLKGREEFAESDYIKAARAKAKAELEAGVETRGSQSAQDRGPASRVTKLRRAK